MHGGRLSFGPVDREAIAQRQRRRQVEEALDEERAREAVLAERLDEVVAERDGPRIDELAFARMQPEDVAFVREVVDAASPVDENEDDADFYAVEHDEFEQGDVDDEIARLQGEISASQRRQLAFGRYLEVLDSLRDRLGERSE